MTTPTTTRKQRIVQLKARLDSIHESLDLLAASPDESVTFEGRTITFTDRGRLEAWKDQTLGELNKYHQADICPMGTTLGRFYL